ncbi:MAG TPA: aspartate/glutamate racemase family protein [bacterium]|nr:aspartate/glutamate racemase family protein [bacterium]
MKTIGLIGGMSWQSTVDYYRIINDYVQEKLGDLHSAPILLSSIDFHTLEKLQHAGHWQDAAELILNEAKRLEKAGADIIFICSNTGNESVERIKNKLSVPVIHIADVTGHAALDAGISKVGLLGTVYTMEQNYIKGRLEKKYGLEVIVPNKKDRNFISDVIYKELCYGVLKNKSKTRYLKIVEELITNGAQGIILGCTEIPLLIKQADVSVPVFDTTNLHATYAAKLALGEIELKQPIKENREPMISYSAF